VKGLIPKIVAATILLSCTVTAYGACFYGWFLPEPLKKPVSLRDGSARPTSRGYGYYWIGGRSHYGGGYRAGK
jgi:hypothetical protein